MTELYHNYFYYSNAFQGFRQDFVRGYAREGNSRGFWGGVPPRAEKKLNSKVSETNFGDSRLPVC